MCRPALRLRTRRPLRDSPVAHLPFLPGELDAGLPPTPRSPRVGSVWDPGAWDAGSLPCSWQRVTRSGEGAWGPSWTLKSYKEGLGPSSHKWEEGAPQEEAPGHLPPHPRRPAPPAES